MKKSSFCFSVCYFISLVALGSALIAAIICLILVEKSTENDFQFPLAINTWAFRHATATAWDVLTRRNLSAVDAVELGCSVCEQEQCGFSVGYGGNPDEHGETTLDAFIMDGRTMNVGAVGALRGVKAAISVARHVLDHTQHSILVGELATQFAVQMGFHQESLSTNKSKDMWRNWISGDCQPNFWTDVVPNPKKQCGPYRPLPSSSQTVPGLDSHDTISMIALDQLGHVAVGTSTNGLRHKIPGRVGDAPLVGAGGYADGTVGAAACTGIGDVMMRFLPSFLAVEEMRRGQSPEDAAQTGIFRIKQYYPSFSGAIITVNLRGDYAAACHGLSSFPFSVHSPTFPSGTLVQIPCI